MSSDEFDGAAFLEWLANYDGHVLKEDLKEQWPNFPYEYLKMNTGPIVDGQLAYYKHDLRRAAGRNEPLD